MPGYLGNFTNAQSFGKFPKCLQFWEIPQISSHLRNFKNLKNIPLKYLQEFGEFPKCLGIWEISQMLGYLQEISQMPRFLGNFPNAYFKKKCKCCHVIHKPQCFSTTSFSCSVWFLIHQVTAHDQGLFSNQQLSFCFSSGRGNQPMSHLHYRVHGGKSYFFYYICYRSGD